MPYILIFPLKLDIYFSFSRACCYIPMFPLQLNILCHFQGGGSRGCFWGSAWYFGLRLTGDYNIYIVYMSYHNYVFSYLIYPHLSHTLATMCVAVPTKVGMLVHISGVYNMLLSLLWGSRGGKQHRQHRLIISYR